MSQTRPHVGIVVLNWNGSEDTLACLASLRKLKYTTYKIYVIDNGSTDGSEEILGKMAPDVLLLQTGGNLGWAGGNNAGISAALTDGADAVWLLNNDVECLPDALDWLILALDAHPNAGAIGSLVVSKENPDWVEFADCVRDEGSHHPRQIMCERDKVDPPRGPHKVWTVKGCSMLMSRESIREVGLLHEAYFLNYEETDWCVRANDIGRYNVLAKDSIILHKGAVSFKGTDNPMYQYFITRNRLLFAKRNLGLRGRWVAWKIIQWEVRNEIFHTKGSAGKRILMILAIGTAMVHHVFRKYGDCPNVFRHGSLRSLVFFRKA